MKEITFKAETSEELFFMIEDFLKGYELNNGKPSKSKLLKENFLKSNPLGTLVRSGTNLYKDYPLGKEYPILDVQVYIYPDKTTSFSVLLKGDNNKTTWKNLKKFMDN